MKRETRLNLAINYQGFSLMQKNGTRLPVSGNGRRCLVCLCRKLYCPVGCAGQARWAKGSMSEVRGFLNFEPGTANLEPSTRRNTERTRRDADATAWDRLPFCAYS